MRLFWFFTSILAFVLVRSNAQSCHQINLDSTQRNVIRNYVGQSVKEGAFIDDKGVVVVTRFIDENSGKPAWQINVLLDDRYKDNPPKEWARLDRDVILFYDGKSRYNVNKTIATSQLLDCLDKAIEDRLYIRPPQRERLMEVSQPNGKSLRVSAKRISAGNSHNEQTIIFLGDGKVRIYSSV